VRPFQPLLLGLLLLAVVYRERVRTRLTDRLLLALLALLGAALICCPGLAAGMADWVGLGRGVDLVFSLAHLAAGCTILGLYSRLRTLRQSLTELAREVALDKAEDPTTARAALSQGLRGDFRDRGKVA
jgi:hypothetical protein